MKKIYFLLMGMMLYVTSVTSYAASFPPSLACLEARAEADSLYNALVECKENLPPVRVTIECSVAREEKYFSHIALLECKDTYGPNWQDIQINCQEERIEFHSLVELTLEICPGVDPSVNCDAESAAFHAAVANAKEICN